MSHIVAYRTSSHRKLYFEDRNTNIHYVADTHFNEYLAKRKSVPYVVRLFSTVRERNAVIDQLCYQRNGI